MYYAEKMVKQFIAYAAKSTIITSYARAVALPLKLRVAQLKSGRRKLRRTMAFAM
jgi:hypothetical protein